MNHATWWIKQIHESPFGLQILKLLLGSVHVSVFVFRHRRDNVQYNFSCRPAATSHQSLVNIVLRWWNCMPERAATSTVFSKLYQMSEGPTSFRNGTGHTDDTEDRIKGVSLNSQNTRRRTSSHRLRWGKAAVVVEWKRWPSTPLCNTVRACTWFLRTLAEGSFFFHEYAVCTPKSI